jgi:hypothetical protein
MIDQERRKIFIDHLRRLIEGGDNAGYSEDSRTVIIEHYPDKQLEEIRRNIVRWRVKAGDPEIFPVTEEQRELLRNWAKELQ